ncbi:glucan endo-1,3-beta-glucosidase-like [Juglans microcarpa x Juglans regia]|uniref:glucan endo-1,3-beta-glucosidase-like n=1 Tax=Juglans microcarpa x Juglans regia TaxID=2249226 RepID=UPI001B7DF852|nr:glucan endo-1,3-beta-glucosidase-like [Juglans microcarpa x Juglans regia]
MSETEEKLGMRENENIPRDEEEACDGQGWLGVSGDDISAGGNGVEELTACGGVMPNGRVMLCYIHLDFHKELSDSGAEELSGLRNLEEATSVGICLPVDNFTYRQIALSKYCWNEYSFINPVINFLVSNGAPLVVNVYPYFAYTLDPRSISLPYALFTSPRVVVTDPEGNRGYQNLFVALLEAQHSALEKAVAPNLQIVVSESGWPSEGGDAASVENAGTFYKNFINLVKNGTPKRPGQAIETYILL